MTFSGSIKGAARAIAKNPTRSLLTTLGIMIGIAAVITMMEIGNGSADAIRGTISKMGVNTLVVMPGTPRPPGGGGMQAQGSAMSLTPEDCEAVRSDCMNVDLVTPVVSASSSQLVFGGKNWNPSQVLGCGPDYFEIRDWPVAEGRKFTDAEVEERSRVCLVGQTIVKEVFGGESPIGCTIRLKNVSFQVIGVLEAKGANMMGRNEDDVVIAPWTTVRLRITGLKTGSAANTTSKATESPGDLYPAEGVAFYPEQDDNLETDTLLIPKFTHVDQIMVRAVSPEQVSAAQTELSNLLRSRHRLKDDQDDDFWVRNAADFMKMLTSTSSLMSNLLLVVALISLVVGGVGIMNIMLVSVTERTREIGLRMAVGARSRDILQQFLVEAVLLCMIGGIIGILLGHGAALAVHVFKGWPVLSSPGVVVAAVVVSATVGIVFGFYPAWKASRMDPIEALRYE